MGGGIRIATSAGKYRMLFSEYRGDWEWQAEAFKWRHYRHNFLCHRCWASKVLPNFSFCNWSEGALWRATEMPEEFFWDHATQPQSVLTQAPGWSRDRCRTDTMHCSNLGLAWLLHGNVLISLCEMHVDKFVPEPRLTPLSPDATLDAQLHDLQCRFRFWLSDRQITCSCRRFTRKALHRQTNADSPVFNSKAAQSPVIAAWLADLTCDFAARCPPDLKERADLMAACVWGKAEYYHLLRVGKRFFSDAEAESLRVAGETFLYCWSELRRISISRGCCLWVMAPKFHQWHHLLIDCTTNEKGNPRFYHCFSDEDMVGKMILAAHAVHPSTAVRSTLEKYAMGLIERLVNIRRLQSAGD